MRRIITFLLLCSILFPASVGQTASVTVASVSEPEPTIAPRSVQIRFEENVGQREGDSAFIAKVPGMNAALSATSATFADPVTGDELLMHIEDANPAAVITGEGSSSKTNYLIGNDSEKWLRNIPTFSVMRASGVYDGIDVVYHGSSSGLEYDFLVAPGANPADIQLSLSGAESVVTDAEGNLRVGTFVQHAPVAYQETDEGRVTIPVQFTVTGNTYGFAVGDYDTTVPLVIDPVVRYATYAGGSNSESALDVTTDADGNVYLTGYTLSSDFTDAGTIGPADPGAQRLAFISKFTHAGALVFTTYFGGSEGITASVGNDEGTALLVDETTREIIVRGKTESTDFPVTSGAFQTVCGCETATYSDAFVARLTDEGDAFVYATYYGGTGQESGRMLARDGDGNLYIGGSTGSLDLPITAGAYQEEASGPFFNNATTTQDGFVAKLNADASSLIYGTYVGTEGLEYITDGGVDDEGNVYTGGNAGTNAGNSWIAKLNTDGTELLYSETFGTDSTSLSAVVVDEEGVMTTVGEVSAGTIPVTTGAFQTTRGSGSDAYVVRFDAGGEIIFGTYLGGNDSEGALDVALDEDNDVYVTGRTVSLNFPVKNEPPGTEHPTTPSTDVFLTKLDTSGSFIEYSTFFGGSGVDEVQAIAVDSAGNAIVAGDTRSVDFPVTENAAYPTFSGSTEDPIPGDVFMAQITATKVAQVVAGAELTIDIPPVYTGDAGMTVTVENNTAESDTIEVTIENLGAALSSITSAPTGEQVGITLVGADSTDVATVTYYYSAGVGATIESAMTLLDENGSAIRSSGNTTPTKSTTDNQNGTVSGGTFSVVFNNTSTPAVTALDRTILVPSVPPTVSCSALSDLINASSLSTGRKLTLQGLRSAACILIDLDLPEAAEIVMEVFVGILDGYVLHNHITAAGAAPILALAHSMIAYLHNQ